MRNVIFPSILAFFALGIPTPSLYPVFTAESMKVLKKNNKKKREGGGREEGGREGGSHYFRCNDERVTYITISLLKRGQSRVNVSYSPPSPHTLIPYCLCCAIEPPSPYSNQPQHSQAVDRCDQSNHL